ncbi:chitin deacetylase [Elysia marginata]|uniref:Chitin deacetylase n=1 Tax=Elysia marginata TaxID=1093978 RepID=A0AAV4EDW3_9GAST|nr:chitin deacetylase [Elysia marginata]
MVGKLHARGMEIGDHSVTHRLPRKWWTDANKTIIAEEVLNQRRNLVEKAGIPVEDIKGWRSPFLQPAGNDLFSVLYENNFT